MNYLDLTVARNFGIEAEVNAADGNAGPFLVGGMPSGIHDLAHLVTKTTQESVQIHKWGPTHWSTSKHPGLGCWVVKPDGSCGLEVCSPVSRGWYGLSRICRVIEALGADERVRTDKRCSLHVHVDVADCTLEEVSNVIAYWIKCEPVFVDAMPAARKCNRFCQAIGLWDWCDPEKMMTPEALILQMGRSKYLTMNTWHLSRGSRATVEFRLGEAAASKNPWTVKNWVRLLLHFVERTKKMARPGRYNPHDPWSSYLWLDPTDVFALLGFDNPAALSPGLTQVKNWFVARLVENSVSDLPGACSLAARRQARTEVDALAFDLMTAGVDLRESLRPTRLAEALYGKMYRV